MPEHCTCNGFYARFDDNRGGAMTPIVVIQLLLAKQFNVKAPLLLFILRLIGLITVVIGFFLIGEIKNNKKKFGKEYRLHQFLRSNANKNAGEW